MARKPSEPKGPRAIDTPPSMSEPTVPTSGAPDEGETTTSKHAPRQRSLKGAPLREILEAIQAGERAVAEADGIVERYASALKKAKADRDERIAELRAVIRGEEGDDGPGLFTGDEDELD